MSMKTSAPELHLEVSYNAEYAGKNRRHLLLSRPSELTADEVPANLQGQLPPDELR